MASIFHKQTTLRTFYAELAEQLSDVTEDRRRGEKGEVRSDAPILDTLPFPASDIVS